MEVIVFRSAGYRSSCVHIDRRLFGAKAKKGLSKILLLVAQAFLLTKMSWTYSTEFTDRKGRPIRIRPVIGGSFSVFNASCAYIL